MSNKSISEQYKSLLEDIKIMKNQLTAINAELRSLEKQSSKLFKKYKKDEIKWKNRGNKKPSGIAVPQNISPSLSKFMGIEEGKKVARTEVTKYIIQYIKDNKLQDPNNSKLINPDKSLKSLLDTEKEKGEVQINYFNIQRFMNKHFIKN